jgi:general secretion pathway protein K
MTATGYSERNMFRRGSVLIIVLWAMIILSILIGSMTFEARLEANLSVYYRKKFQCEHLAKSGIEIALMLMNRSMTVKTENPDAVSPDDRWQTPARRLAEGLNIEYLTEPLGNGSVSLSMLPEPARRNVNKLGEEDWERVLEVGKVPQELWPVLIESALDWIDADSNPRRDGAETEDYYSTLEEPYRAKNGPLDTVDELLRVRGFTRTILYGGYMPVADGADPIQVRGISDLLTTYGDGKVNVNAASRDVLMTLPDVDEIVAGAILEEREGRNGDRGAAEDTSFKNDADFMARIPGLPLNIKNYVVTVSTIYKVTSVGSVEGVSRTIHCIGNFKGGQLDVFRWWEEE